MKLFCYILFILFISVDSQAGGFSEIDLMSREALVTHFKEMNLTIEPEDINLHDVIKPFHNTLCDLEASATVRYTDYKGHPNNDTCYVCFSVQTPAKAGEKATLESEDAYCL